MSTPLPNPVIVHGGAAYFDALAAIEAAGRDVWAMDCCVKLPGCVDRSNGAYQIWHQEKKKPFVPPPKQEVLKMPGEYCAAMAKAANPEPEFPLPERQ